MVLLLLHKVVLLRYCLCTWLPCRKIMQEPIIHTRWVACEHRYLWTKKREILVEDTWKVTLVRSLLVWPSSFSCVERIVGSLYDWYPCLTWSRAVALRRLKRHLVRRNLVFQKFANCVLSHLADLKETCKVLRACWVGATSITSSS